MFSDLLGSLYPYTLIWIYIITGCVVWDEGSQGLLTAFKLEDQARGLSSQWE